MQPVVRRADGTDGDLDGKLPPVPGAPQYLAVATHRSDLVAGTGRDIGVMTGGDRRRHQPRQGLAHDLLRPVAEQALGRQVEFEDAAFLVDHHHRVHGGVHEGAGAGLAAAQLGGPVGHLGLQVGIGRRQGRTALLQGRRHVAQGAGEVPYLDRSAGDRQRGGGVALRDPPGEARQLFERTAEAGGGPPGQADEAGHRQARDQEHDPLQGHHLRQGLRPRLARDDAPAERVIRDQLGDRDPGAQVVRIALPGAADEGRVGRQAERNGQRAAGPLGVDDPPRAIDDEEVQALGRGLRRAHDADDLPRPIPVGMGRQHAAHLTLVVAHRRGKVDEADRAGPGLLGQQLGEQEGLVQVADVGGQAPLAEPGALADIGPDQQVAGGGAHQALGIGQADP